MQEALPPIAKPIAGAAVSGAPLPSFGQVLASATQAIPAEAPAPSASLKVANPSGKALVNVPFPNVQNVFSVLEKLGRRRLLADGAPALAPGPQPAGTFPALVNLEVGGNQANPNDDTSFAESQWYKTEPQPGAGPQLEAQPQPLPQAQPDAQLQAQPQPMPMPQGQPQPLHNVELQTQETAIGGLPAAIAQAPVGAQPGLPQPGPQAPRVAPGLIGAPDFAPAPKAFGPIPSEVKVFAEKLANFLGAEARSQLPKRIEVNAGAGRRRLAQDGPEGAEPLPAMPLAAEAPMAAPGEPCSKDLSCLIRICTFLLSSIKCAWAQAHLTCYVSIDPVCSMYGQYQLVALLSGWHPFCIEPRDLCILGFSKISRSLSRTPHVS